MSASRKTNNGKQQNIEFMFKSINQRNNDNNELWNKRQPGILASPPKCNKTPIIIHRNTRKRKFNMISSPNDYNTLVIDNDQRRIKRIKSLSLSPSKGSQRRKIKNCNPFSFNNHHDHNNNNHNDHDSVFSSFNAFNCNNKNTHKTDIESFAFKNVPKNKESLNCIDELQRTSSASSLHLFTTFDEDRTPARNNQRMTQFRKDRILNRIGINNTNMSNMPGTNSDKKRKQLSHNSDLYGYNSNDSSSTSTIPSSASKSGKKKKKKKKKKIIIQTEEDIDNIINVDPRRLSLDEHPLLIRKSNQSIYSQPSPRNNPEPHRKKLSSLLDSLLSTTNDHDIQMNGNEANDANLNDAFDYFDDDLDETALLMALYDVDNHKTNTNVIKRLSFDNNNNNMVVTAAPSTPPYARKMNINQNEQEPAIDFSPNAKRTVNSPLSQKQYNRNMGSVDTQQMTDPHSTKNKDRYYRFQVVDIINDYHTRSKILRVKDLRTKPAADEDEDIDVSQELEWTIEIREDWYESIICVDDIIHVIGETVETMRRLFDDLENKHNNNTYPIYMTPNENLPIILDICCDIIIDNLHNYLVIHPDCLMIPTRIASSYPCQRKEILANNIRFSEEKAVLLYGNMAHELFQETLNRGNCNQFNLQNDLSLIISKYLIQLYCINETEQSAREKLSEFIPNIRDFFNKYINCNGTDNNIVDWGSFEQRLQITKVVDIEERIWSPMFGICGNIDATIQSKTKRHLSSLERQHAKNGKLTHTQNQNDVDFLCKLLPFELKTGKENPISKMKARAQLALYSLMLADRYDTSTDGGFLYYLKTGHLMGIPLPHQEIRALLIRRNFLAKYFNSHPKIDRYEEADDIKEDVKDINQSKRKCKQKELPELLTLPQKRVCSNCFSKTECFLYHKVQCYNNNIEDICKENITSTTVYSELVSHLNGTHLEYMNKWIELIDLEETYCLGTRHEIWAMDSVKRESKSGKCLANMIISHHEIDQFKHIYTFVRHPDYYQQHSNKYDNINPDKDIIKVWDLKFRINTYITISTEDGKYGLASGTIIELNTKYVKFASKKPIKNVSQIIESNQYNSYSTQARTDTVLYRLDIDDTAYGYNSLRANIFYYFFPSQTNTEMDEIVRRKRQLLVDLVAPQFTPNNNNYYHKMPAHLQSAYIELNIDQQNAVKHVLECNDYALILGMPGTGKSATIIFLLRLLISFGYKVLLSAYTNSAIDHLCLKLLSFADVADKFVRIGNLLSINSKLSTHVLDVLDKNKFDNIASIGTYLAKKNIFAVTSTSSTTHPILTAPNLDLFDYCIIDEAGQLTEAQVLGPLRKCRKFVLVGDNNQLPPLVRCKESERKGMSISLFERLAKQYKDIAVKSLTIQYRMNADILLLSNCLTYNGQMKCGSEDIAKRKIKLNKTIGGDVKIWLKYAMDPNKNVILFNTDNLCDDKTKKKGKNNVNEDEANMIEMIVNNLFKYGIYSSQIGVMAPYRSQLKLIKSKLDCLNVPLSPSQSMSQTDKNEEKRESALLLDTIDRFQGSDRDIIIISFTHTRLDKKVGAILKDWRRINVALTRAKCKLILIASITAFKQSKSNVLKKIVDISNKQNWIYNVDSY